MSRSTAGMLKSNFDEIRLSTLKGVKIKDQCKSFALMFCERMYTYIDVILTENY